MSKCLFLLFDVVPVFPFMIWLGSKNRLKSTRLF
jgi:hypothetical protein